MELLFVVFTVIGMVVASAIFLAGLLVTLEKLAG